MKRILCLALLAATAATLVPAPSAGAVDRVSPNYRLNSDPAPFRGQDQVALAVNPNNPQHVVAVYAEYLDSTCEASASLDGGRTWSPSFSLSPPALGFVRGCSNTVGLSPYVEFGSGNNVYTVATSQKQGLGFLEDPSSLIYKSTDGGVTWGSGVVALPGGPGSVDAANTPGPAWYRPGLAVAPGAGTGGADRVILVGRDLRSTVKPCGVTCQPLRSVVSNDGGQTFGAPIDVTPEATNVGDFASKPVVNDDGTVTVAWRTTAVSGFVQVARSNADVTSWGAPVNVTGAVNTGTPVTSHVTPGPSSSASYPRMVKGPGQSIYMVYSQGSTGPVTPPGGYLGSDHFISPDSQVWFQRSNDRGATWSNPKRISEQTTFPGARTHQTRHPTISFANNRINVVWHDRRHWFQGPGERNCSHSHIFCEDIRLGDTYYSYSTDGGSNFSKPLRVTDRSINLEVGYDTRPSAYWWFGPQSVTVGNGEVLFAWMDSREGNWDTDTEDIYLARVNFNATGPAPHTNITAPDAINRSVAVSKLGYPAGNEGALVGGPRDPANPPACGAGCPTGPASRNASSVVIVNDTDAAGALAGAVLARANPGPVLLSPAAGLPAAVKAEVSRIRPGRAFVIGDTTKLSGQVVSDLQTAGISAGEISRVSGSGDAGTAAEIAARMDYRTDAEKTANNPAFDAAVIANPASPDAKAVAGLAAARRLPVLYVTANAVPAETQAALTSLDIDKTLVIGGSGAIADSVLGQLPSPTRRGGADQYATSRAVVEESRTRGLPTNVAYVADGGQPMDAAMLGAVVGRATGILVLAPAPLYLTANGQVDASGLDAASRTFVLGAAAPSPAAPPRRTYPAPPGGDDDSFAGCSSRSSNVIRRAAAADTILGTPAGDRIFAGAGNDNVNARAGNDCIDLGDGTDRGQGGTGNDLLLGGDGRDRATGNSGRDRIRGGAAGDRLTGSSGRDSLSGNSGGDRLSGGSGNDRLTGSSGRDRLSGGSGRDVLSGGSGNDRISARDRSRDRVTCGSGRDTVTVDRRDRVSRNCERVRRRR